MRELKLFVVILFVASLFLGFFLFVDWFYEGPPDEKPSLLIENEDDPNWDCEIMGNGVCGL